MSQRLTARQQQIADMVADGQSPAEIALILKLKDPSVRSAIHRAMKRLGCKSMIQLSARVWRQRVRKLHINDSKQPVSA